MELGHRNNMTTFQQGQAPWETGGQSPQSYGVGNAPWEQNQNQNGGQIGVLPKANYLSDVGDAFNSGVQQMGDAFSESQAGRNPIETGAKLGAGAINTVTSPLAPIFKPIGTGVNWLADKISNIPGLQKFAMSKPGEIASRGAETVGNLSTIAGVAAGAEGVKPIETIKDNIAAKAEANAPLKVSETIAPKPTIKEARLAQSQGRLVKGSEPGLFKSGTPDRIIPSGKTVSATQTILRNIPKAGEMNPSELYNAVDKTITQTANKLRPEMEATPIKPETIQKITDDWSSVKKSQMSEAPASEEANVAKRQAKFESFLKKSEAGSHADLWDTRMNYDKSISPNVKNANSMSPESLQLQKNEWLQNREILNGAINDTTNGMGKTSQQAFKDMTNLYEAKRGLTTTAKLEKTGAPSKLSQAYNSKMGQRIRTLTKFGVGGKIVKDELGL